MTSTFAARARCRERLEFLAAGGRDPLDIVEEANRSLRSTIGFASVWLGTLDPANGLVSTHLLPHDRHWATAVPHTVSLPADPADPAFHAIGPPMRSLSDVTGNSLDRSQFWSECLGPANIGDVMRVLHAGGNGPVVGWAAYRSQDDPPFHAGDVELLNDTLRHMTPIVQALASGGRSPAMASTNRGAGVLLINDDLQVVGSTPTATEWLPLFRDHGLSEPWGQLPPLIYSAIGRARSPATLEMPPLSPVRMRDGSWVAVDAGRLDPMSDRYAVTIRPANADETFTSVCRALALSNRETEIGQCVRAGLGTQQIAQRLFISPHTVKVHLKTVFRKAGVTSRTELISVLTGQPADETDRPDGD